MIIKTISFFHGCMVWIEKSVKRVTDRHHEADTFSCVPFDLPHLIFQRRTCCKVTLLSIEEFLLKLNEIELPATAVGFFMFASNLHKVT